MKIVRTEQDKMYNLLVKALENLKDQINVLHAILKDTIEDNNMNDAKYTPTNLEFFVDLLNSQGEILSEIENGFKQFI